MIKIRQAITGGKVTNLVEVALLKIYLAQLYVSAIDNKGELKSLEKDKPNMLS